VAAGEVVVGMAMARKIRLIAETLVQGTYVVY